MGMEIPGVTNTGIPPEYNIPQNGYSQGAKNVQPLKSTASTEEIKKSLEILRRTYSIFNRRLKFSINREINRVIVKVIDGTTDKVIKEIPAEEIQRLVARIKETIGLLFDEKI